MKYPYCGSTHHHPLTGIRHVEFEGVYVSMNHDGVQTIGY